MINRNITTYNAFVTMTIIPYYDILKWIYFKIIPVYLNVAEFLIIFLAAGNTVLSEK